MYKKAIVTSVLALSFLNASALAITNKYCAPNPKRVDTESAIKWYKTSAEQKVIFHEVYLQATKYVKEWVAKNKPAKNSWGVVIDIDETALDNSWYYEECLDMADNEDDFSHYIDIPQKSTALPGVIDFTHTVHELGGYVSLVSNRDGSFVDDSGNVMDATKENLTKENIYYDQVVLANRKEAKNPTDKNPRFKAIESGNYVDNLMTYSNKLPKHQIVAYLGDNIKDFPNLNQEKMKNDKVDYDKFGKGYFMLPNPMYGSWD